MFSHNPSVARTLTVFFCNLHFQLLNFFRFQKFFLDLNFYCFLDLEIFLTPIHYTSIFYFFPKCLHHILHTHAKTYLKMTRSCVNIIRGTLPHYSFVTLPLYLFAHHQFVILSIPHSFIFSLILGLHIRMSGK